MQLLRWSTYWVVIKLLVVFELAKFTWTSGNWGLFDDFTIKIIKPLIFGTEHDSTINNWEVTSKDRDGIWQKLGCSGAEALTNVRTYPDTWGETVWCPSNPGWVLANVISPVFSTIRMFPNFTTCGCNFKPFEKRFSWLFSLGECPQRGCGSQSLVDWCAEAPRQVFFTILEKCESHKPSQ